MRTAHLLTGLAALATSAALMTGCNLLTNSSESGPSANEVWESSTDLVSEYGGYDFTDEAEAFGDPLLKAVELEENLSSAVEADSAPPLEGTAIRILWGQLERNPELSEVTDWTGSLSVSSGRLAVLGTIAFERMTDHVLPRRDRQSVAFTSRTRSHFDGLLLLVRRDENDPDASLRMETAAYHNAWSLDELHGADLVFPVDDLGNAVSITAVELPEDPACAGGALRGHWLHREGERGIFRGVWMSAFGHAVGHMRGHFGLNEDGEHVWFGKIIGRGGRLIGLARGTYAPSEDPERPGGTFSGHWSAREGERTGEVGGHYVPAREGSRGVVGFFHARWRSNCGDGTGGESTGNPL